MTNHTNEFPGLLSKFQLPNSFKVIGFGVAIAAFLGIISIKLFSIEIYWLKDVFRQIMLLGFLMVILSKEKIEDEMIMQIRANAFGLAFIFGIAYALTEPYIDNLVDLVFKGEAGPLKHSSFTVISFMLIIQMGFFEQFKRQLR